MKRVNDSSHRTSLGFQETSVLVSVRSQRGFLYFLLIILIEDLNYCKNKPKGKNNLLKDKGHLQTTIHRSCCNLDEPEEVYYTKIIYLLLEIVLMNQKK